MKESGLEDLGFLRLTEWELRNDKIKPQSTDWDNCSGWLYAFVTGGLIRYVGMTSFVLRSRLDGYSYQANDRVGGEIYSLLSEGRSVEIYGARRQDASEGELKAEESALIQAFDPDWNVHA
jgi:hypothetical protein